MMLLFKPVNHVCKFAPMLRLFVVRLILPGRVVLQSEQLRQDLLGFLLDLEKDLATVHQQFDVVLVDGFVLGERIENWLLTLNCILCKYLGGIVGSTVQLIHLALVFVLLHLLLRKTQMVSDLRLAHFCQDKYLWILRFIRIWLN